VTNLSVYLAASVTNSPDAMAVVSDDTTTTYWKLGNDVARFADYLTDAGLRPGDRVGVMLPNGLDFATIFYGVLHAGGVVVPLIARCWDGRKVSSPRYSRMRRGPATP
jgi:long-chain acyl-CoA synthetase